MNINLQGRVFFIAGIGDDQGLGWAIAKALANANATVAIGVWPPVWTIFNKALELGKFDQSRQLSNGRLLEFAGIYPLDAAFDTMEEVPVEVRENKRYQQVAGYTLCEVAEQVKRDFPAVDGVVHALANAPEIRQPLHKTSRKGYLSALNASTYSFISLLSHFSPFMREGSAALTLSYLASGKTVPGYGGGMSSAKAALEQDVRTLAWELGRDKGIRVNAISAGPYASRAARAIGFIDKMIQYSQANAPLSSSLCGEDIGHTAAFLLSPFARAITGVTLFVDHGLHVMGVASDSKAVQEVCV